MAMEKSAKTILIVDDEPDIVTYLKALLEDNGYQCHCAYDGVEGVEKAQELCPDLICLDISMPEKSGVKMYRELRDDSKTEKIPVIIVTGVSHDFEKFISTRSQVPPPNAYIAKPIDRDDFLKQVAETIDQSEAM
jgi:CheY-like chemotaxis protein